MFVDEAIIEVFGGSGGNGCIAFRREKYVPRGGPSGGDGGHGGSVVLIGNHGVNTLHAFRYRRHFRAERGRHGEGSNRTGRTGSDLEVQVPLGTLVYLYHPTRHETGELLGEIVEDGARLNVAQGGRGGRGNARFATSTHRTPRIAEDGRDGEERFLRLELKLLADVGLVGLPNAGKSTLISTVSAARPKIADYPFTTIVPNLGVVAEDRLADPFVIADLPGLIEGASEGTGLGFQFLRHVERCRVLVHLVDLSPPLDGEDDPDGQGAVHELETLEHELEVFNPDLLSRQRLIVGSKLDAADDARRLALAAAAEARGLPFFEISSATRRGLEDFVHSMRRALTEARRIEAENAPQEDDADDIGDTRDMADDAEALDDGEGRE